MLILYFRVAVLTPGPDANKSAPAAADLASHTIRLVTYVFILYALWDILGIWMAMAKTKDQDGNAKPLYPVVQDSAMTNKVQAINWVGFGVTLGSLAFLVVVWLFAGCFNPDLLFFVITAVLLLYRWAKEVRTTWELPRRP